MHEFGHIANYWQMPWTFRNSAGLGAIDYTWNGTGGLGIATYEWGTAGFEEAFATLYGAMAYWLPFVAEPTSCASTGPCYTVVSGVWVKFANSDIEATSFRQQDTNNCVTTAATPEARQPISPLRFLWDVFDSYKDGPFDTYSSNSIGHWARQMANFTYYATGTGENKLDEPWNGTRTVLTEKDGRGSASFAANYAATQDVSTLRPRNCSPP